MAWTSLTKRAVGDNLPKSWLDALVDNATYLYNILGGAGSSASTTVQNGSFENDTDSDGVPDGWTQTLYTGGSGAYDTTTPAHGAKAYKFTSPGGSGNGGGYLTSDDYLICSEYGYVTVRFMLKSSAADIKNIVRLLWYTSAKEACSTASTDIYSDDAANPTSWTEFIRGATPPSTARYFKIRLIGADSADDTAGNCTFDAVSSSTLEQDVIIGTGATALSATYFINTIYMGGSSIATSGTVSADGANDSISGVVKDVAGGVSYVADLREGTTSRHTVTLALTAGLWTVHAIGHWRNGDGGSNAGSADLTVIAIRQA